MNQLVFKVPKAISSITDLFTLMAVDDGIVH